MFENVPDNVITDTTVCMLSLQKKKVCRQREMGTGWRGGMTIDGSDEVEKLTERIKDEKRNERGMNEKVGDKCKERHEAFILSSPRRHSRRRRWRDRKEGRGMRVKGGAISLGSSMTVKQSAEPLPEVNLHL